MHKPDLTAGAPRPTASPGVAVVVVPTPQGAVMSGPPRPASDAAPETAPVPAADAGATAIAPRWGGRALRAIGSLPRAVAKLCLAALAAPFARLSPAARDFIGYLSLATIGVSLAAVVLQPVLVAQTDVVDTIREQAARAQCAPAPAPDTPPASDAPAHDAH